MTPEVQQNKLFSGDKVVILDTKNMQKANISLDIVFAAWDRGILLAEDIYIVKTKEEALQQLIEARTK